MPSPYISPEPRVIADEPFFERDEVDPDEREVDRELDAELFARALDPLDFLPVVEDLREVDRDAFDEEDFFALLLGALLRDAPRDAVDFRPVFFARPELLDFPAAFPAAFFFLATGSPPLSGRRRSPDHTIPILSNRDGGRVVITPLPAGLRIEIKPLVRSRRQRRRLAFMAAGLVVAALFAAARLATIWEAGLRRGNYSELSLPLLIALSAAVGVSTPLVLLGLAALAFAEETVEVGPEEIVIRTAAFEAWKVLRVDRSAVECWRETLLPLPPWWTWAVARLALRASGRLQPIAAMAGPREKRMIGAALARATGKPFVNDFGRELPESSPLLNSFSD